jgi:RNA polymerase sigma factor (TIGR02999 family)
MVHSPNVSDVTQLLDTAATGDQRAARDLLPLVYDELRKLAAARLKHEPAGITLNATALVHEAYLRLVDGSKPQDWSGRGHFFAAAAEAMRRILVERARRRASVKGGGGRKRVSLDPHDHPFAVRPDDLAALDEALTLLERHEPQAAGLVKLRYFAGMSHQEAADAMGISRRVADGLWALARAWLFRRVVDN